MIQFGTKADTLENLRKTSLKPYVLPLIAFTVADWEQNSEAVWQKIATCNWGNEKLIIRSSASNEDGKNASLAGKYRSVLNVSGRASFYQAVDQVIASYDFVQPKDQVFCQPMLKNVKLCGVAFTVDPNTGGNYYIINSSFPPRESE